MNIRAIRSRRAATLGAGLAVCLALLPAVSSQAAQAAETSVVHNARGAGQVKRGWTPERLRAARPLPVQVMTAAEIAEAASAFDQAEAAAAGSGQSVSANGQRPAPGIRPLRSNRLFDPAAEAVRGIAEPAGGSTGARFTSQRLIPADADLEYPYSTVGVLFFTVPGEGDFYCSGAVVRRRVVVTAGGCVHEGNRGSFFDDFLFVPAYRDGDAPYGIWEWNYVTVPTTWSQGNGKVPNAADYAFIAVDDQVYDGTVRALGQVTGTLGYQTNKLRPNHATMLGYPINLDGGNRMRQVTSKDFKATPAASNSVEYGSDMRGGSQGGPLIQDFGHNANLVKLIGVLSYFPTSAAVKTQGASIPDNRFTSTLNAVCSRQAGNC